MNISEIIETQRQFYKSQKTKNVDFRIELLKSLKKEILKREQDIYEALKKDFSKPKFESYLSEVGLVILQLDLTIKNLKKWTRPKRVSSSLLNFPSRDYIYQQPYGTVLIIAPWNYPFLLAIEPLIMAISAGNTAVLKPSELTSCTSDIIEEIVSEVFQPELAKVVKGGVPVATELLNNKWDYIFFTGSVKVGRIVAKAASKHMTPVTLELGGKSPCIVDDTVDLKLAAKRIVWGKFLNGGQTCIAPDFLLVHHSIKEQFIDELKLAITRSYGENPESSSDYARIINAQNLSRLTGLLEGCNVVFGGKISSEANYLAPTLVDNPELDSAIMKEEIFGPILPIVPYKGEDDIDVVLNKLETPLSLYVFSKNSAFADNVITKYNFGAGVVNDVLIHFGNHQLPFGGVGESGIGAYHGRYGFEAFSHKKAIVKKANWLDIPFRYRPYKGKFKGLKAMFKWFG